MEPVTCYLGLGANLGDRAENLRQARRLLDDGKSLWITRASSVYETAPWGYTDQPDFLNCVLEAQTTLQAGDLLRRAQEVETEVGRQPNFRYGPRAIDVDILLYGDQVVETPDLQVPHPRMTQRAFVLVPLAELCPELRHPVFHQTIKALAAQVEGREGVKLWSRS